jgi:hypothetical protein
MNKVNYTFVRYYRKSAKFNLELSDDLKNAIIGLMLGDLHAEKRNPNSNTRLQFKQSIVNKPYIDHLYSMFKAYCSSEPKITSSRDNRPGKKEFNVSIKFWSQSLPCFNLFRELFYDASGLKYIPLNLEEMLTPGGLAYWAMDDGYKSGKGFYFCTESFSLADNNRLSQILKDKFNLSCGVHKHTNGYRLYVFSSSRDELLRLIQPYLISHFNYKFDL